MREVRIFCDKCQVECSDNYYTVDLKNITFDGSYTIKELIELCPACFGRIDMFLDTDFSVPLRTEDYDEF